MVTFRSSSNNRRPSFRNNNNRRPQFRRNDEGSKFQSSNFHRKLPNRNNNNAPKLIEKYNDLAREALANEDKILSENYFQHADHFTRVLSEQESLKKARFSAEASENKNTNEENNADENNKKEDTSKKTLNENNEVENKVAVAK